MKPEIKEAWLKDLATAKQTTTQLRLDDSFCCLGVLCNVAEQDGVGYWEGITFVINDLQESSVLPDGVQDWAGFPDELGRMPFYDRNGNTVDLTDANDNGCTFVQISDLIKHFF